MFRTTLVAALIVGLFSTAACQEETQPQLLDPQSDADSSNESGNEATGESEIMFALTAADPDAVGSDDELAEASESATASQFGGTCVTSVTARNVVTYTLTNCTGPFGFVTVSGDLVATYTLTAAGVQAHVVGTELAVNEGTASVESTVVHSVDGDLHTLDVDTTWTGITKNGDSTSRTGDYISTIDPVAGCVTLDGDWSTTIGNLSWDTVVDAFGVCRNECPVDGGSIEWVGPRTTTTVSYDGTSTAQWENSNGRSGTVRLFCGQ